MNPTPVSRSVVLSLDDARQKIENWTSGYNHFHWRSPIGMTCQRSSPSAPDNSNHADFFPVSRIKDLGHGRQMITSNPRKISRSVMIPEPHYTLIETSKGKDPAIVVVNSALRTFDARSSFPWHLKIGIDCKSLGANGMPTAEEGEALQRLEEAISKPLQLSHNAMFLARITCRSERILLYRVQDPEIANELLQALVSEASQLREWDYRMEHDPGWELAKPELQLLESDPLFN